jgi:NAD(P)H-hydrate repair Nnr-like enzyme with NAD(P)H-hydrate dehydratase domain
MTAPPPPFRRQTAMCTVPTLNTRAYKAVSDQLMTWGVYTGRKVAAAETGGRSGAGRGLICCQQERKVYERRPEGISLDSLKVR